ncbi:MAG: hypothetical protein QOH98_2056 [Methylobacteriaceae bacterium]|jgi:hypothetical protein|nr:hypothetical protein [Methylobacteriaceae bacterium]
MGPRIQRQLDFKDDKSNRRPAMSWLDHLIMLLHIGAEIEHGLMVQYLYAAYSLGGDGVPKEHRPMVQRWQDSIITVAKEEMGHLLTVQNVLTLLGAPINLDRENFPWDVQYYPFAFNLEPLNLQSLSRFVFAEMPAEMELSKWPNMDQEEIARIIAKARENVTRGQPHRVGAVYGEIIELLKDKTRIPDSAFNERSYDNQQDWDDWGRSYHPDAKLLTVDGSLDKKAKSRPPGDEARVLIDRVATRAEAVKALEALSEQGEAPHLGTSDKTHELSHFQRFAEIFEEFENIGYRWDPVRGVPTNPTTFARKDAGNIGDFIEAQHSRHWGDLFNLRYRMLLMYLAHTFRLARSTRRDTPSARGMMMHKVFGEMYNLKAIAGILVRLPLTDKPGDARRAGPPFEIPYTLVLPPTEMDAWRLHADLLDTAAELRDELLHSDVKDPPEGEAYLKTLGDLDDQSKSWVDSVFAALGAAERLTV